MKKIKLLISIALGIFLSGIFVMCFSWVFWLLGAENIQKKWNNFMDSLVFNK